MLPTGSYSADPDSCDRYQVGGRRLPGEGTAAQSAPGPLTFFAGRGQSAVMMKRVRPARTRFLATIKIAVVRCDASPDRKARGAVPGPPRARRVPLAGPRDLRQAAGLVGVETARFRH